MAMSLAKSAFAGIKKAVELGREVEDVAGYFGKFFDAKDQLAEASQYEKNQPMVKKLFSGSSVEAQALEVTAARHKMAALEKELREYLLYTGQVGFYEDMMKEVMAIAKEIAKKVNEDFDEKIQTDKCRLKKNHIYYWLQN